VSPGYFETLEIELLDGRTLTERDTADATGVAVVNEAFARDTGGNVLGRRLRSGTPRFLYGSSVPDEFTIVGIVGNERFRGLEQPVQPAYYLSTRQFPQTGVVLLARTAGDPVASTSDIRAAIRETNPAITLDRATSLDAILSAQLAQRRVTTDVIGGFALVAVALAALGMYGLLAVLVGSRTREIGVRMAIGASPGSMARQVVANSVTNAAIGVALGSILAIVTGRLVQSLLVGVTAGDPLTFGVVAATMLLASIGSALVPARRAARIDPADALRAQ
jgi:predicted lysophospholipase L1 biosynthesis ABC-type transport system permease subunit